jgi:signal transduction histidine kinase/ABC-type amino acid transport substrate-binding protein
LEKITSDSSFQRIAFGGPEQQPPFAFYDGNGLYTGFSVEYCRGISGFLRIDNVLFYPNTFAENLKALSEGRIDAVLGVRYTPELARDFLFLGPYLESPTVIFVRDTVYDIIGLGDLRKKKVAMLKDDPAWLRLKQFSDLQLKPMENLEMAFVELLSGTVDAYIGERLTTGYYLSQTRREKKVKIIGKEIWHTHYGLLIRRNNTALAIKLRNAISRMQGGGQLAQLSEHWFGERFSKRSWLEQPFMLWVILFIAVSLLVALMVLGWNLLLQRELQLKAMLIEKVELDKKIDKEKSRFKAIVQSMTEGLMLVDPSSKIAYINQPGLLYLNRHLEELVGQSLQILFDYILENSEKNQLLNQQLRQIEANKNTPATIEFSMSRAARVDLRCKFFAVWDPQGEFAGRGILIEEITKEKQIERLKLEFVSVASHELRTPMTSILGFSELILTQNLGPELSHRYTQQIHSEAERLTRILNDMLDMNYLESGEGVLSRKSMDLAKVIGDVVNTFSAQLKERQHIYLHVEAEGAPDFVGDKDKIAQVLWNLLSNADKYSPPSKAIEVFLTTRKQIDPNWKILPGEASQLLPAYEIKVRDYGQGIPEDQLPMIFIPFYRIERDVHTIRGTGLGLAIVRRIVEAHGGRIWAESRLGESTTLVVLLPQHEAT